MFEVIQCVEKMCEKEKAPECAKVPHRASGSWNHKPGIERRDMERGLAFIPEGDNSDWDEGGIGDR